MNVLSTPLDGVLIIEPSVFGDDRGWFFESFNHRRFAELVGEEVNFVQDNHSMSSRGVLRGIHFQSGGAAQSKLVRVTQGEVFDVAVDLRVNSETFGHWTGATLNAENKRQLWVPAGFGHAFLVVSDVAEVQYKVDAYWSKEHERTLQWDDPSVAIAWPWRDEIHLSEKDRFASSLKDLKRAGDLF